MVRAATRALEAEDVELVLPYVHEPAEDDVRRAFDVVVKARAQGPEAREVADRYFFETVVRLHRQGEGAPFTGLKPAGLDVGPVIPVAEAALDSGDPSALIGLLTDAVRDETSARFHAVLVAKAHADDGLEAARTYVESMLGLQVWAHKLYGAVHAAAHEGAAHEHH